ncbi:hypothetical protein C0993_004999 [Termitomyces sp. T159_Od127]|nr:hypothetical protein C0993_004999 [Termitomyces sp. T159_Od127]
MSLILAANAGSSSLKISLFRLADPVSLVLTCSISNITAPPAQFCFNGTAESLPAEIIADHESAFAHFLTRLDNPSQIACICHRVVHGGDYAAPVVIDHAAYDRIAALSDLAPLHNGAALAVIKACLEKMPSAKSIAYFDSAFHTTIPRHIASYAIDQCIASKRGLRKYGFHGLSYSFILRSVAQFLERPPTSLNLIVLHLGSGASACAIKAGQSLDTSMGLTPLSGLPGATRSGAVDPSLIFHYTNKAGRITHDPGMAVNLHVTMAEDILNRKSGWKVLTGTTDFGEIVKRAKIRVRNEAKVDDEESTDQWTLAFDLFVDRILDFVGAYHLKLGAAIDALVFSGGIGERSKELREVVAARARCLGYAKVDPAKNAELDQGVVVDIGQKGEGKGEREKRVLVCRTDEQKTYPVNIKEAVRDYIYTHGGGHPDEFKDDINLWQNLRKDGVGGMVHVNRIDAFLLSVSKYPIHAAGVLAFLKKSAIPKMVYPPGEEDNLRDLSESFATSLELLMLAQAQECSWQMAKLNRYKNALIAKVAARVASLYQETSQVIRGASPSIKDIFPSDWLPHIEAKCHHFAAVSEYRKSMDEIETSRYGIEIARLQEAQAEAKKAYDIARRGRIKPPVIQDIQSLLEIVQKNLSRAERDNDLIYHHDVPAVSSLISITQTNLVSSTVPPALHDPSSLIGSGRLIFGELVGWGTKEAINIYNDRRHNLIKEKILNASTELQDAADEALRILHLPSSLEALERPVGLPPSLLRKAEEIRHEDGPTKIEVSIEDVQRLSQQDQAILDEAMDVLDNEASEDEAARKYKSLDRLPSHEANVELIAKEKRYRTVLTQAAASDETVRQKWDEWEQSIVELTWSEEDLEASIPSSTLSSSSATTVQGRETQNHSRALRVQIEALDDVHRARGQLVRRAQTLAAADDIQERVTKIAAGFARLAEVTPAMFEDVLDEELAKYDKFFSEMNEIRQRQGAIIAEIQRLNDLFLRSRKDDPAVKEREHALQNLELAYHKYREIMGNLDEGIKLLDAVVTKIVGGAAERYSHLGVNIPPYTHGISKRRQPETSEPSPDMSHGPAAQGSIKPQPRSGLQTLTPTLKMPARGKKSASSKSALGLPALSSTEWDFEDIKLPPPPTLKRRP